MPPELPNSGGIWQLFYKFLLLNPDCCGEGRLNYFLHVGRFTTVDNGVEPVGRIVGYGGIHLMGTHICFHDHIAYKQKLHRASLICVSDAFDRDAVQQPSVKNFRFLWQHMF